MIRGGGFGGWACLVCFGGLVDHIVVVWWIFFLLFFFFFFFFCGGFWFLLLGFGMSE